MALPEWYIGDKPSFLRFPPPTADRLPALDESYRARLQMLASVNETVGELRRQLAEAGLDASVDDHSLWRAEVERSAALIAALASAAFLATAFAAGAAIAYATRAGLAAGRTVIQTLSLNGATDGAIAALFMRRFGLLAAAAGAIGAGLAAALLIFLRFLGGSQGLTQALPLAWSDLLLLSPCPLLAATVAVLAARFAAMKVLGSDGQDG